MKILVYFSQEEVYDWLMQGSFKIGFAFFLGVFAVSLITNLSLLIWCAQHILNEQRDPELVRAHYNYISPRVFSTHSNDVLINFVQLRTDLRKYLSSIDGRIAIYMEYLPSGVSIGINEKENFLLASLLKVPVVMAVYELKNSGKLTMEQMVELKKDNLDPGFGDLYTKGVGHKISVKELVHLALKKSDNTAYRTLVELVGPRAVERVFDSLDIPKDSQADKAVVTAKNYSSVLRSLYLSSYLPVESSNEILDILTQTEFTDKLDAGVPDEVKVAHKIGSHEQEKDSGISVFSDCGIVYVPKRPYILCMMMEADETKVKDTMKHISEMVYIYIISQNTGGKNFE